MRLHSWLIGTSTEVGMRLQMVMRDSISLRMDSAQLCGGKKRMARALSSRIRPSKRCSLSMYELPYRLASYRAKKMTRRAFSLYLSNNAYLSAPMVWALALSKILGAALYCFQLAFPRAGFGVVPWRAAGPSLG